MDPKEMLSKEIATKVRGHISQKSISEKVEQFFKQGNAFLLLEILDLRSEVKSLSISKTKRQALLVNFLFNETVQFLIHY